MPHRFPVSKGPRASSPTSAAPLASQPPHPNERSAIAHPASRADPTLDAAIQMRAPLRQCWRRSAHIETSKSRRGCQATARVIDPMAPPHLAGNLQFRQTAAELCAYNSKLPGACAESAVPPRLNMLVMHDHQSLLHCANKSCGTPHAG